MKQWGLRSATEQLLPFRFIPLSRRLCFTALSLNTPEGAEHRGVTEHVSLSPRSVAIDSRAPLLLPSDTTSVAGPAEVSHEARHSVRVKNGR